VQVCKHFLISGKVQGVSYRAATQKRAEQLHIVGWVRNLSTGEVEVLASGSPQALDILSAWLWKGPLTAEVTQVSGKESDWQEFSGFQILK
jgi:acylphosphatase